MSKLKPRGPEAHLVASFLEGDPPEWSGKCFDCDWELLINDKERVIDAVLAHEHETLAAAVVARELEGGQLELAL